MMGQQPLRRFAASRRVCSQHPCNELVSAITAATTLAGFYQINMDTTLERCHRNRSSGARVNSTNGAASRRVCSRGQPVSAITAATTLAIFYQINWSLCPLPTYCYDFCFFFIYREATDEDTCAPSSNELSDSFCCNISCYMDILRIVGLLGHHIGNS